MKKSLAVLFCFIMFLIFITMPSWAEETSPDEEDPIILEHVLSKSYAVLLDDVLDEEETNMANNTKINEALVREFEYLGYTIEPDDITISAAEIDVSDIETTGYVTFQFTVDFDEEESETLSGYIVPEFSDVIFKYEGSYKGTPIAEEGKIRIAHAEDGENKLFTAPAMDDGTIEIFGPYYAHMEAWTSPDVFDCFELDGISKLVVQDSFYRVQLHIGNINMDPFAGDPEDPPEVISLNWFGFDLIQDDAYCVKVDATSDEGTQLTFQWGLNRYAVLNNGNYLSEVFFGNDTFELSLPENGIGGVTSLSLETDDFQGYTVSEKEPGKKYEVSFKSDFYDRIILDITINTAEEQHVVRELTVHRVGVQIQKEIYNPDRGPDVYLFHGTQYGTKLDYADGKNYRLYATYCIPDGGTDVPYGLYVTYAFADGTTTEIITEPCDNRLDLPPEEYQDGVFINKSHASCCDYLIYAAEDENNAPVKVCVTVLKGDPQADETFEGIFFGSGTGVEWINEED